MGETLGLFEERRRLAVLDREQEEAQALHRSRADEVHVLARELADKIGRKACALGTGLDLSTISNQLSCVEGRGYPSVRLLDWLGEESVRLGDLRLPALLAEHWNLKAPVPKSAPISDVAYRERVARVLDAHPDLRQIVYGEAFGPGVKP